jgi:transcriptional regulator with XRE-family HTH domain
MNLEIANRLQELRKKNGYSQEELASKLGVSRQAVSKWERSESSPDTDNLICLAQLYGVSLDELLKTDKSIEEIASENQKKLDEEPVEDLKEDLKDEYRKEVIHAVEGATAFMSVIGYLLIGFITSDWGRGWVIFFALPIIPTFVEAIINRDANRFAFPVLVTAIYLTLGMYEVPWGWHPGWVIFFSIPLYYLIIEIVLLIKRRSSGNKSKKD